MINRVLVPLDRSPFAEQAIGRAAAIARATGAMLDLLLVHEIFGTRFSGSPTADADTLAGEQRYLQQIAAEVCEGASLTVTGGVHRGPAAATICERAGETGANLIVMTTHGRVGLARMALGSVADEVVRNSTTPVLLLRPIENENDRRSAHHLFKRILVPLDGSGAAAAILPAAVAVARACGATMVLLRVIPPVPIVAPFESQAPAAYAPLIPDETATGYLLSIVAADLDEMASRVSRADHIAVESDVIVSERAGPAIVDYARAHAMDLVAMSTHGRGASRLLLGSVADKVLHDSGVPVLLQRPGADSAEQSADMEAGIVGQLPSLTG